MIKAVIFDWGGVLVNNAWSGMLDYYSKHLNVSAQKFNEAYKTVIEDWQSGKLEESEFWEKMTHKLDCEMPKPAKSIGIHGILFKDETSLNIAIREQVQL